jgi:chromosome segregation ATPase
MSDSDSNGGEREIDVLRLIWNEMKAFRSSLHSELEATRRELGERIDRTNDRLEQVRSEFKGEFEALRRRMTESEVRLATATTELAGETRELAHLIRDWREEHRSDRADLKLRVARIERHLGLE